MLPEDIKKQVLENQSIIDELNRNLKRKTQEVRIIQEISAEINTSLDLNLILQNMLKSLDATFGFEHSMILLMESDETVLKVAASYGYDYEGLGAEVQIGQGVIGVVAKRKKLMRMGNIGAQMNYMSAVKTQMNDTSDIIKLPGLKNVQSQVAIPLLYKESLIGVLAVESEEPNLFDKKDELIVTILADQAASAIVKAKAHSDLKELNESLEEKVKLRTEEVVRQKEEIEIKNGEITDSIKYAKRIQDTILPKDEYVAEHLPLSFVVFKPKDIISGDFYWVNQKENYTFFSVIDCTGHGVPGALVSIVGHSLLQRTLFVSNLRETNLMLDSLSEAIESRFNRGISINVKDGMDMALCRLNRNEMELDFSGANNPVYIIRKGKDVNLTLKSMNAVTIKKTEKDGYTLFEVKGDKQPIGGYEHKQPFNLSTIKIEKGDSIYVSSDGFADQFGGPNNKKFKNIAYKELLISMQDQPMDDQKKILENTFTQWKGKLDQADDICIMGIRI